MNKLWIIMKPSVFPLYLFANYFLIFYLCLKPSQADQAFKKPCDQAIDCGANHVIVIADVRNKATRVNAKNLCNGKRKCQLRTKQVSCTISYYCIDDRFTLIRNCSQMDAPVNIGKTQDLFWCYKHANQGRANIKCWDFFEDVYHHWIVLRGFMKIKTEFNSDWASMENFEIITRVNKSKVCTSSKYIWAIYIGTKSSETAVNFFAKTDLPLREPLEPSDIDKSSRKEVIPLERNNSAYENVQTGLSAADTENQANTTTTTNNNNNNNNNMSFLNIIIIISVIGAVIIILIITTAIIWCCCRRCNSVTIVSTVPEARKESYTVKDPENVKESQNVKNFEVEEPNVQMRTDFLTTDAKRDTYDSVGFWTDDEDYDPSDDRHSKIRPQLYATTNCIYQRQSSKGEIYMNAVIPPPPCFEKDKNMYINMNSNPERKHFNVFL